MSGRFIQCVAVVMTLPADGATDQPLRPTFDWIAVVQGESYTLEIDDDPTFASPELVVAGITDTTFTPDTDLLSSSVFHWRVSADNACGVGPGSSAFTLTTVALPGDCGFGTVPVLSFH